MQQQVNDKIRNFIESHVNAKILEDNADIFQLGFVSSLFAMQLVGFVEREFNISVKNDELKIDNFKSINNLSNYVNFKLGLDIVV